MSSIRRILLNASIVLASVVITFLALNLAFNIAMPYSIKQGALFPRALLDAVGRHYHTFYPDTNDQKFDDWIAVLGDSYAAGSGDAFTNDDRDYSIFHHMHRRDGENYYIFGRGGFGTLESVKEYFVTTREIKNGLFYPKYHAPKEILFLFYEGNDLNNNLRDFEKRSDAALSAIEFVDHELEDSWSFERRKEFYLPLAKLISVRRLKRALHFTNEAAQTQDLDNVIRFEDGTLKTYPVEKPQSAAIQLDTAKTDVALQVMRESLMRLKNQSPSIPIKLVYIPSVVTSYTWKGPIEYQAYGGGGPPFTSTAENFNRSLELRRHVSDLALELGFAFVDSTDAIVAAGKTGFLHGERDPEHFNARGYGIVADVLLKDSAQ